MKKFVSFIRHSHPEIYKGILFVIAIGIIVAIFPKQGKFKYEFQNLKGKPWHHEDLIAPFDFAIKKTKQELALEKLETIKQAKLYFKEKTEELTKRKELLRSNFEKNWSSKNTKTKENTLKIANKILDSIYSKGIIEYNDVISNKPQDYTILVLKNNIAEEHELKNLHTVKTAYAYIQSTLEQQKADIDRIFILSLLENAISHSIFFDKITTDKVLQQSINEIAPSRDII
ncbi:MAG: hypothetical protein L6Q66_08680, partial [Bacteroidia bacterium]|nr:hypothetical protein [Bacteroidia bacterium]